MDTARDPEKGAEEFRVLLAQDLNTGTSWGLKENFDRLWKYSSAACSPPSRVRGLFLLGKLDFKPV